MNYSVIAEKGVQSIPVNIGVFGTGLIFTGKRVSKDWLENFSSNFFISYQAVLK